MPKAERTDAERDSTEGAAETRTLVADLAEHVDEEVLARGWVHGRRDLGGIQFLLLRDRTGIVQCVFHDRTPPLQESSVEVRGRVVTSGKAPGGLEIQATGLTVLSEALVAPPVELAKDGAGAHPDTLLAYRHISVRAPDARATLQIQAELVALFRDTLRAWEFTEIFTPKVVAAGAEGGSALFEVDYYGQRAFLAQSPQLYKQIMVAVHERVFEVAPVFRAEASHTSRHLAEYLSLDVEYGFIRDETEVMELEEALVKAMLTGAFERHPRAVAELGAEAPRLTERAPRIPLLEARELVRDRFGHTAGGKDLDPEAERLLGRWAREEHGSDLVFVTDYPQEARPFYTYPTEDGLTRGVDLLFRGVEISSGGQRVHEHAVLVEELRKRGMDPERFAGYLEVFQHGMPPHGGFALGAERLTAALLGIPNVRFARAFPRDGGRLHP